MNTRKTDIAVIGGGAAGLTAAAKAASMGMKTLVIERNSYTGGVLPQCIHNGFGIHYFHEELTGPEYAEKASEMAEKAGADLMLSASVMKIEPEGSLHHLTVYSRKEGVTEVTAKAVILACGCRERCRGNLGIPGDRIAGVLNAGLAQQMLNREGMIPGRRAVIIGSGDIGLIMARRLTWCGVKVECVIEIMPWPAGLSRNIAQCLEDFNIPLYLSSSVTGIHGKNRVEFLTFAPLKDGVPDLSKEQKVQCDTVLLSVGLIPENELARQCGIALNPVTGGAMTDSTLMTGVPGIFSCGNVLHVHDLVDYVSEEAERCAENAVRYVKGECSCGKQVPVEAGENVRYTVPNQADPSRQNQFFLRARLPVERGKLVIADQNGTRLLEKNLRYIRPAEMISVTLPEGKGKTAEKLVLFIERSMEK